MTTTLNPSDIVGGTLSNGDTRFTKSSDADGGARAVASISSARYFEIRIPTLAAGDVIGVGIAQLTHDLSTAPATGANFWAWFSDGALLGKTTNTTSGSFAEGSRIRVAINGASVWFGDETDWISAGDPAGGTGAQMTDVAGTVYPVIFSKKTGTIIDAVFDGFYYTPPTGFDPVGDDPDNPSDDDPTTPNDVITYADPNVSPTSISAPTQEAYAHGDSVTPVVTLNAVDVSANLTGAVRVRGRRGEAKSATFTIIPSAGSVDATDWIGKAVTIDFNHVSQKRVFTGRVEVPEIDPVNKSVTFTCTDGFHDQVNNMTRTAIDAAVGGWWSEYTDNKDADNFDYMKARVATREMAYDLDASNTGILSSLAVETTPHFSFDNSTIDEGSFKYKLAERSRIINKAQVSFDFRFTRLRHRERRFYWSIERNFEEYLTQKSFELPTRAMLEEAVNNLVGINYRYSYDETLPLSGTYFGQNFVNINPNFLMAANWWQAQRFSQDITENYVININAPQSQGAIGTVLVSSQYGLTAEYDTAEWEKFDAYESYPAGFTLSANGDRIEDQTTRYADGRSAFDNAIKTAIAKEQTRIRLSHRENTATFKTDCQPELERHHTISATYNDGNFTISVKGRVLEYEHVVEPENAVYDTLVTIDMSKTDPASPPADPGVTVPSAPDTSDAGPGVGTYRMATHLGGEVGAPVYDDTWEGFTGNVISLLPPDATPGILPGTEEYPRAFNAITQPVDAEDRAERAVAAVSSIDIPITDDLLTLTVS